MPSYFWTTRIRNPLDVAANIVPNFGEDQLVWKGAQVEREHVQSDTHRDSELRKWWFSRSRKFYSAPAIEYFQKLHGNESFITFENIFTSITIF